MYKGFTHLGMKPEAMRRGVCMQLNDDEGVCV